MEVQALKRPEISGNPLRQRIGHLIGVVGNGDFEQSLFEAAYAATRCSHLTAFVSAPDTPPRTVVAINAGPLPLARSLATKYIQQYWYFDPANCFADTGGVPEDGAALRLRSGDIASPRYRSECYTGVELRDRFSLVRPICGKLYRLNFYCGHPDAGFGDDAVDNIMDSADLLMALLVRQASCAQPLACVAEIGLAAQLHSLCPAMPDREIQICVGIARGLTSEGIALENGIALNTVLTYRKRAYTRLGISSQNELLRCLFARAVH